MKLYRKPYDSIKELLDLTDEFSKVTGYKSMYRNPLALYTLVMKWQKDKLRKQFHSKLHQK